MTEGRDASAQQARMRPPEAQFDRELELVLGPGAAAHEQQTYLSFLGQFSTELKDGSVDAAVQIPLTAYGGLPAEQVVEGEPESVVPPSLATFAAWRSNHVDPNAGLRREWEACAPEGHESSEPEGEVARDDNGVVTEELSRGTSGGFFLDAPTAAQVGNFVEEAGRENEEETEDEDGEENEYFKAGGGLRRSQDKGVDDDDVPEVAMGEADELGERMTFLRESGRRNPSLAAPVRSTGSASVELSAAEEGLEGERPDSESTPFDDGKPLKAVDGVPGLVGQEERHPSLSPTAVPERPTAAHSVGVEEEEEPVEACFEEGDDAIQPFALDPEFDYEHVTLTPNPLKQMREEWKVKKAPPPTAAS